jgi:hypothetical protein
MSTKWRGVGAWVLAGVVAMAGSAAAQTPPAAAPNAGDLAITVVYKGKGDVKPGNEIAIFLFDTPTINAESNPIGMQTLEKNSGVANFTNLPETVYIAVVYDEKGVYDQQGPPPTGTPTAIHAEKGGGPALPVKTGKGAKVTVTFDDTSRMP